MTQLYSLQQMKGFLPLTNNVLNLAIKKHTQKKPQKPRRFCRIWLDATIARKGIWEAAGDKE